MALPADERPPDHTPIHTSALPATPVRDRNIPATAWVEAPTELLHLGDDLGGQVATYKRRIGRWLLWRAGPATRADARYLAVDSEDLVAPARVPALRRRQRRGDRPRRCDGGPLPHLEGSPSRRRLTAGSPELLPV